MLAKNAAEAYNNMTDIKAELARMQTLDKKLGAEKLKYQQIIKKYLKDAHKELVPGIYSKEISNIDTFRRTIGRRIARIEKRMGGLGQLTNAVTTGSVVKPVNMVTHANQSKNQPANGNGAVKKKASPVAPAPVAATPKNVKTPK